MNSTWDVNHRSWFPHALRHAAANGWNIDNGDLKNWRTIKSTKRKINYNAKRRAPSRRRERRRFLIFKPGTRERDFAPQKRKAARRSFSKEKKTLSMNYQNGKMLTTHRSRKRQKWFKFWIIDRILFLEKFFNCFSKSSMKRKSESHENKNAEFDFPKEKATPKKARYGPDGREITGTEGLPKIRLQKVS